MFSFTGKAIVLTTAQEKKASLEGLLSVNKRDFCVIEVNLTQSKTISDEKG